MRWYWIAAMLSSACAGQALGATCYVIYDRNDAVIYRDLAPPFDLSDPKAPERDMMRRQKQHLLIAEFDQCNPVGFISPTTGATTATVDEIVQQLKPAVSTSISNTQGTIYTSARPGMAPAAAPAPRAPAPAARSY
jgi:hypothetical protein